MRRRTLGRCILVIIGLLVAGPLFIGLSTAAGLISPAPSAQVAPLLTVRSGYTNGTIVVDEFLPSTLRIVEGTTVTWVQEGGREHHVAFVAGGPVPVRDIRQPENPALPRMRNPLIEYPTLPEGPYDGSYFINSGVMEDGEAFSVTFSKAGTYPYACLIIGHQAMTGTVEVVGAGASGITTQEDVDRYIRAETAFFEEQAATIRYERGWPLSLDMPDGTNLWFVRVGAEWRRPTDLEIGRTTLRAYLPDRLTVQRGDTVVWYSESKLNVHTVTFPVQGAPPPPRWIAMYEDWTAVPFELLSHTGKYVGRADNWDWPRILEDSSIMLPARPKPTYDPSQFFSSGQLSDADTTIGKAWSLTFDAPGQFYYFCLPHVEVGQIGQITVQP